MGFVVFVRRIAFLFIFPHYARVCLKYNLFVLTLQLFADVVGWEIGYILDSHKLTILFKRVQVRDFLVRRPRFVTCFPEDLELASSAFAVMGDNSVNDPFSRVFSEPWNLNWHPARKVSVVIGYMRSQQRRVKGRVYPSLS